MSRPLMKPQEACHEGGAFQENMQLRFITSTNPTHTRDNSTRQAIRSHAARKAYRDRRQKWRQRELILHLDDPKQNEERTVSSPSPVMLVGQGISDPFGTYPIPVNQRTNILLNHFLHFVGPGLASFLTADTDRNSMKTVYLPFSLVEPCVFRGLLMLSAGSYARQSGDHTFNSTALEYKSQCIGLVNVALQEPAAALSDAVIAAVMMLAVQELLTGNMEAFRAHMNGLRSILSLRGGLHTMAIGPIGRILQELCIGSDFACTMYAGTKPLLNRSGDQPMGTIPGKELPIGFRRVLETPLITSKLSEIIHIAKSAAIVKAFGGYEFSTPYELAFFDQQCHIIEKHIVQLRLQARIRGSLSRGPAFEECICLAIWVFNSRMLRSLPRSPLLYSRIGYQLRAALTDAPSEWDGQLPLLLWIAFIGIHARVDESLHRWYVALIKIISIRLQLHTWNDACHVLQHFLWIQQMEVVSRDLWTAVEAMQMLMQ